MITKFVLSLIALLIVLTSASGQVVAEKPGTDSKAEQELKAKAMLLLAETSQQARDLKNRENQVAARIELANLMWADQETSARRLYREAFDILRESPDSMTEREMDYPTSSRSLFRLRTRLVESLGEHDPVMARELLRQLKIKSSQDATVDDKSNPDAKSADSQSDGEAERLEMKLTTEMADRDPEEAVRAARESLNKGISSDAYVMIRKLAEKNPKIAGELTIEFVDKLRKADYKNDHDAIQMALWLIRDEATSLVLTEAQDQGAAQAEKHPSLMSEETLRSFIEFIVDASFKKDYGEYLLGNLQDMQVMFEKVAPAQAARIKQKWADLEKQYPELVPQNRYREALVSDDVEKMLESARSAEPEARDIIYSRAATAAWSQGDKARAVEIAAKILHANERQRVLTELNDLAISDSMRNGDFAEARKLIAQTSKTDERVRQLLDLAEAQAAKGDSKAALEILNELQDSIPAKPRNSSELNFQIRLAESFAVADPDRSFALLSSTIDQINDLIDATARVANFISSSASVKDNEFDIQSHDSVPGLDTLLSQGVKTLATADFGKTRSLFDKFQRPEIRLAAYLHLSRVVLEPERECSCSCPNPANKPGKPVEK